MIKLLKDIILKIKINMLTLLNMLLVSALITSNVVVSKTFNFIGDWSLTTGALCFIITYLISNTINLKYGKNEAFKSILLGFIAQIFSSILILIITYIPNTSSENQEAYNIILGQNWIAVIASLIAYMFSQSFNYFTFSKLSLKLKKSYLRGVNNFIGNLAGHVIDAVIFNTILFYLGFGYDIVTVLYMIISTVILKTIISLIYTPIFYIISIKR